MLRRKDADTFLKQIVAGVAVGASGFPAIAQDRPEPVAAAAGNNQTPLAETLARYAAGLKYEDLPDDVVRLAKRTILDTIGCAFGGYTAGPSKIAIKLASDVSSKPGATVLISGISTSPDLAVFANGVMIRYLDFNDAFVSLTHGAGHPSDTLAALLSAAELNGRSGRDLITATVLSYEVFCKIADVFDYLGNGIDHSTITGMAAVVGAGSLMGLTTEQMVQAIGITVGGDTATRQGRADALSNWKAYAAADACRKAMFSVQLAQNGMTGPSDVFEGRYGFFKVMGHKPVAPPQLGRAVRYPPLLHQALSARPVLANRGASRGGSAVVLQDIRRYCAGQHQRLALRDQDHGGWSGQVAAVNARNRRPQHPLCCGRRADVWQDRP